MPTPTEENRCSFCKKTRSETGHIVKGRSGRICEKCVERAGKALAKVAAEAAGNTHFSVPDPRAIHAFLDEFVIGQDGAKRALGVAVFDHYLRLLDAEAAFQDDVEIEKTNILMLGPTGSGKTYLVKTLARMLGVPFTIADATRLTQAGFVGDDVEDILSPLLAKCGGDPRIAERSIVFIDEIDKIASAQTTSTMTRDVGGRGVQQALLKLLEGSKVMVPIPGHRRMGQGKGAVEIDTTNILFIVSGAFPALAKIVGRRVNKKAAIGIGSVGVSKGDVTSESDLLALTDTEDLKNFGFIPEFLGRIPVVVALRELTEEELSRILTEPRNALLKQYQRKFTIGCKTELEVPEETVLALAKRAVKQGRGARGLRTIVDPLFTSSFYDLPSCMVEDDEGNQVSVYEKVILTPECVTDKAAEPTRVLKAEYADWTPNWEDISGADVVADEAPAEDADEAATA